MSIEITDDLVKHVARLSRLGISSEEAKAIKAHFQKILAYISAFQSLETKDVDPTFFSLEASNVYREDEPRPSLTVEEALKNAPQSSRPYFVVPRIVGDAESDASGEGEGA
jgi:aspartyl-tRNA(Asn)/glutamyl-tRNA(Gln) amidotransferase subunit C